MKKYLLVAALVASSAMAVPVKRMVIGADNAHLWWSMSCGGIVCQFQEIIQPMTEAGADTLDALDDSKVYECDIKSRLQWESQQKRSLLAYEISGCTLK